MRFNIGLIPADARSMKSFCAPRTSKVADSYLCAKLNEPLAALDSPGWTDSNLSESLVFSKIQHPWSFVYGRVETKLSHGVKETPAWLTQAQIQA